MEHDASIPERAVAVVDSAALACRIAAGDETAFASFYEIWFPATLALARTASRRDEAFCLDIVQDVMLVVAKKMPRLHDEASVGAWMTRTVFHAVTDRVRSERRRRRREERAGEQTTCVTEHEPWHLLALEERRQWLGACLQELSVDDRALLLARFGDTTTVTAAGALLGLGPDRAHGRLRRVLERLRQKAAEWLHVS